LFYNGVDGIEIYSELDIEIKKDLISKVRTITKDTNQHIPIIYNISYYRSFIKNIYSFDKNEEINFKLKENFDLNFNENQIIYIFRNKKEIEDFKEKYLLKLNRESYNDDQKEYLKYDLKDNSNRISSCSLPYFLQTNNNILNNLSEQEDRDKEFESCREKFENDLKNNETNSEFNNYKNNIYYNNEIQEINENIEILNLMELNFFKNKNFGIICTEPVMNFQNFHISDLIHINFGEITFTVDEINENYIKCNCMNSGNIKLRSSFSVEGKDHLFHKLVETRENKLLQEINDAIELKVDFIVMGVIDDPIKEIK